MARYRFLERSFFADRPDFPPRLIEVGEEVDLPEEVYPGPFMQPVDAAAVKRFRQCLTKEGTYRPAPMKAPDDMPLAIFNTFDLKVLTEGAPNA